MNNLQKTRLGLLYGASRLLSDGDESPAPTPVKIRGTRNADTINTSSGGFPADATNRISGATDTDHEIDGSRGNDTYILADGTNHDVIKDYYRDSGDKIKIGSGIDQKNVRLNRDYTDHRNLIVEVLDGQRNVIDSLKVLRQYRNNTTGVESVVLWNNDEVLFNKKALDDAFIRGTKAADVMIGSNGADVFHSDAGGNDTIHGNGGNDTYYLGNHTDKDTVFETNPDDDGDKVIVDSDVKKVNVRTRKVGFDLYVEILDGNGVTVDSLKFVAHYAGSASHHVGVESVVVTDDDTWGAEDLAASRVNLIKGLSGNDNGENELIGRAGDYQDEFDASAGGNDDLKGGDGNDTYYLKNGGATDHDTIYETPSAQGEPSYTDVVKIWQGIADSEVRLNRDGNDLLVQIIAGENRVVTDSFRVKGQYGGDDANGIEKVVRWDNTTPTPFEDLATAPRRGTTGKDTIEGTGGVDYFHSDAGGNDILEGKGGNDIYWLGEHTEHDAIKEVAAEGTDTIKVEKGIDNDRVQLNRVNNDLYVEILGSNGEVKSSLRVKSHYTAGGGSKTNGTGIEKVILGDGKTIWDEDEFDAAAIRGKSGVVTTEENPLVGNSDNGDTFDTDGDRDEHIDGEGGDDTYILGHKTGNDTIQDYYPHESGDSGDRVKIKSDTAVDVRLRREGLHLFVEILDDDEEPTDSLKILYQYEYDDNETGIESVVGANNEEIWSLADINGLKAGQNLIEEVAAFNSGGTSGGGTPTSAGENPLENLANGGGTGG